MTVLKLVLYQSRHTVNVNVTKQLIGAKRQHMPRDTGNMMESLFLAFMIHRLASFTTTMYVSQGRSLGLWDNEILTH